MRIAVLGATSQIAKDLICAFARSGEHDLVLFARRPEAVVAWKNSVGIRKDWSISGYEDFTASQHFDAVMNFVGVGNPAQAATMGASIFEVTLHYDELALAYVRQHANCRYIFLSSGAAYGSTFDEPATESTIARIPINNLQPQDWYGAAKLHAECRHRTLINLSVVDIRLFNYFSRNQDIEDRFFITDILRAIRDKKVLKVSPDYVVRDFIHPHDFYSLVNIMLHTEPMNIVIDAYSKAPVDKPTLLAAMQEKFGLDYEIVKNDAAVNATGSKPHYYSLNIRAGEFGYSPKFTSLQGLILEKNSMQN